MRTATRRRTARALGLLALAAGVPYMAASCAVVGTVVVVDGGGSTAVVVVTGATVVVTGATVVGTGATVVVTGATVVGAGAKLGRDPPAHAGRMQTRTPTAITHFRRPIR